jgi:hypothetical protein
MSEPNYPKAPGIYCLEINGYKYIGHSRQLNKRLSAHKTKLRNNRHDNKKLQNYYNKYPEVSISIVQILDVSKFNFVPDKTQVTHILKILEQTYFNLVDPHLNLHLDVFNNPTVEWTEERRNKLSVAHKGRVITEATRLLMSKPYYLVSPEGTVFEGFNLEKFCRERNFNSASFCRVMSGNLKQYYGWTSSLENHELLKAGKLYDKGIREPVTLFKPFEGYIDIEDLPSWCKENNYNLQSVRRVVKNKRFSAYGYYLSGDTYMKYLNTRISVHAGVSYSKPKKRWLSLKSPNADESIKPYGYFETEREAAEARLIMEQICEN